MISSPSVVLPRAVPVLEQDAGPPAPADPLRLLAAAEADADALADALHDGVLQSLVVARYAADAAARGGDVALVRDAVQEALVALRRAVWLIRPRGESDLVAALHELQAQVTATGGVLRLELDHATADALAAPARVAAYRFVQAVAAGTAPGATCAVRLAPHDDAPHGALLEVTGALPDPSAWAARAAALGGRLDASRPQPCLLLPLTLPDTDPEGAR